MRHRKVAAMVRYEKCSRVVGDYQKIQDDVRAMDGRTLREFGAAHVQWIAGTALAQPTRPVNTFW